MSYIETFPVQHSTIMRLYSEKDEILLDPDYQRMGGIWTLEKKQLLIDSILNDYDIPKIYLHSFSREEKKSSGYAYAVIDGRQRLETIWTFIEGKFTLADDFVYQDDEGLVLRSFGYADIATNYPKLKIKFDSFVLPVIGVQTDDQELIEDMFSRLNEAVPLNAAEKRNSIGGAMVAAIRDVASHEFFNRCVAFGNRRFQHRESAARMLLVEENLATMGKIIDTKKEYLDAMARNYHDAPTGEVSALANRVISVLDQMNSVFVERDELLRAQGNMTVYYIVAKSAKASRESFKMSRKKLLEFRDLVRDNRVTAEENYGNASFELLEYDRLTQQGTNDASNIRERVKILSTFLEIPAIPIL
ncbi:DUF262 domain-containing protein [Rhodoferax sediminis]|uniref:DUF262 domain-containing protein n=1 Tax=Rhodoferax sediminis TaxID=2509614 RepID=A0A515D977_9BURK|nr:DUF262 domain-containing protein [Rhodoferax sediminis]QDL36959.1 DUF262 domain-containing protein [Rhodoferax sediminis]